MKRPTSIWRLLPLLLVGCGDADAPPAAQSQLLPAAPAAAAARWRSAPADGPRMTLVGDTLRVATGPHVVIWPAGEARLEAPYAVEATLHKRSGRIYEGYGLVFGATRLDAPESAQAYGYVLVRGDGSYLVKRRDGAETPVVRGWTAHPAVLRDRGGAGQPNRLRLEVGEAEVRVLVNGTEVSRIPSAELPIAGGVGIRVAHDVELDVVDFTVRASTPGSGGTE